MSWHKNITIDTFPKQQRIGVEVAVIFHFDSTNVIKGKIVRSDLESPKVTIIELADGRFVLGNECDWEIIQKDYVEKKEKKFTHKMVKITLNPDSKYQAIGEEAATDYLDMDSFPAVKHLLKEGDKITEEIWDKMYKQGRKEIEIKKIIQIAK